MLMIIPCGATKRAEASAASHLYTGSYFRACLGYARSVTTDAHIRILSAKHGLVRLDDVLEPYNVTFGDPGAVTAATLHSQAAAQGLAEETDVRIIGGRRYVSMGRALWPQAMALIPAGLGIGQQLGYLKRLRTGALQ